MLKGGAGCLTCRSLSLHSEGCSQHASFNYNISNALGISRRQGYVGQEPRSTKNALSI